MRCIFCKQDSSTSKTIEHIIPESLGNKEYILPAGVVCDSCNNYFALNIEKPLLETDYFRAVRFRNIIYNKKERIPTIQAFCLPAKILVEIERNNEGKSIIITRESDLYDLMNSMSSNNTFKLLITEPQMPKGHGISRFLGKVAIETLALTGLNIPSGIEEIIDKPELDELRQYVRRGNPSKDWPFHMRRIYHEDKSFYEASYGECEILHSFKLLYTESQELYLVLVIFGIEYCINMGGPEIDGYIDWLKQHDFQSPLRTE